MFFSCRWFSYRPGGLKNPRHVAKIRPGHMVHAPGRLFKFEISQARNLIATQGAFTSV